MIGPKSLAGRLFIFSTLWLVLALVATAFLLSTLYSRSVERSFHDRLNITIESLAQRYTAEPPVDDVTPRPLRGPDRLRIGDPKFQRPLSGWYWRIYDSDGVLLESSRSADLVTIETGELSSQILGTRLGLGSDDAGARLQILERDIQIDDEQTITIQATANDDEFQEIVGQFRGQALIVLVVIGFMLAIFTTVLMRLGLRPLKRLTRGLEQVREGNSDQISGVFPTELTPVVTQMNALIEANSRIVEQARNQVGNLAHALKTPLAVISNEAQATKSPTNLSKSVTEQSANMRQQITHYLDKAHLATRATFVGKKAELEPVLERLCAAMEKIHQDRAIAVERHFAPGLVFRGEAQDLEEIAGNILDNGCKWATSKVILRTKSAPDGMIELTVEDDGQGIEDGQKRSVTQRGMRLDETVPGTGLGLNIVMDLIEAYQGKLTLYDAENGGLGVKILLPATKL